MASGGGQDENAASGAGGTRPPAPYATPEQAAIAGNRTAIVHRLVDALPEELRQPLALSAIDEMTSREIAPILGIPEGTVRTRIMRARQILKHKLANSHGDMP